VTAIPERAGGGLAACVACVERHIEEEAGIIEEYRGLARTAESGPIGLLIGLILADEERHHSLLRTVTEQLRDPLGCGSRPRVPWPIDRYELRRHLRKLSQHERETIAACRRLKSELPSEGREFLDALFDAIILDCEKHHRLLRAIHGMVGD
jgi:hypothetical protein